MQRGKQVADFHKQTVVKNGFNDLHAGLGYVASRNANTISRYSGFYIRVWYVHHVIFCQLAFSVGQALLLGFRIQGWTGAGFESSGFDMAWLGLASVSLLWLGLACKQTSATREQGKKDTMARLCIPIYRNR